MKQCTVCNKTLPEEMFEPYRNQCKECRKNYRITRRKLHPEIHLTQALRRQKKQGEFLNSLKTPCIVCGEKNPVCIDFHHLNPEEKEFSIGKCRNKGKNTLLKELSKCVCLCSNCHRKVHAGVIHLTYFDKSPLCKTGEGVTE